MTASAVAPAAPLGKYADFASAHTASTTYDIHAVLPSPGTVKAWWLRSYAREALTKAGVMVRGRSPRMRWCGSRISRGLEGVNVYARPDRAYGRIGGVCVCGQSLCCPVCAPRIAAFRSREVAQAYERAVSAGFEARLVTYTVPHHRGSTLGAEIDSFAEAWRRLGAGRRSMVTRRFSLGNHVGRECTYSAKNGWHYHFHQLRYDRAGSFDVDRGRADWLGCLASIGRRTDAAEEYAFDSVLVGSVAGARYVAKLATSVEAQGRAIGLEVAAGAMKGRNLATLLHQASQGDAVAERVWVYGVGDIVSRKVSSVRWSPGLREKLALLSEKSDQQVAEEEVVETDQFLGALTHAQWRGVLDWKAEFALCVCANQGEEAVNSFLNGLGLGSLNDDSPLRVWRETFDKSGY